MRFWRKALLGAALLAPLTAIPSQLQAQYRYRDIEGRDEHRWDRREDRAYRMWLREQHRRHSDFRRLRAEDQARYWAWRHQHSDALLHINIR